MNEWKPIIDVKTGDRVELVRLGAPDPDPIPDGSRGTVTYVSHSPFFHSTQVGMKWDSGRTLALVVPPDQVKVITGQEDEIPAGS